MPGGQTATGQQATPSHGGLVASPRAQRIYTLLSSESQAVRLQGGLGYLAMTEDNKAGIAALERKLNQETGYQREAAALAIALGSVQLPPATDLGGSLRFGHMEDKSALAFGGGVRLSDSTEATLGFAHGLSYSQSGFSAGINIKF